MPTVHVILNPKSGGGRAGRLREEISGELRRRGVAFELHETQAPGHAVRLACDAAQNRPALVVAAGGDGTIHDVANGLLRSGRHVPLGILPLGTGNDFAKIVPGAENRTAAYDTIARHTVRAYDAGWVSWQGGGEFFVNGMGTGIDVEVVRQIQRLPAMPGSLKYLLGLFRALAVYRPVTLRATLPDAVIERSVMMFAVGNGICQGGGFYLTPHAHPDDATLEMCLVREIPIWQVPVVLPLVLRGTHARHEAVTMCSFDRVRLDAVGAQPLFFQLDGELREPAAVHSLEVEVRPGVLPVAVRGS